LKKQWHEHKVFGEVPFKRLVKMVFKVEGMKNRNDAAFIQYNLLVLEEVHRAHIEFETQKGFLLYNPLDAKGTEIIKKIPKPFKATILEEEEISYEDLLSEGFHLN
jgi:hypothetical protein